MDIIKGADPNIVICILTGLFAFLSWMIKGLIERPINESKLTFNQLFEKRLTILYAIKVRLSIIAYFPQKDGDVFKEQIQNILLQNNSGIYLDKKLYADVLKISITPQTDEDLLLKTIMIVDETLNVLISKKQDEISFYNKYSNFHPLKRFFGYIRLSSLYIISMVIILAIFIAWIYCSVTLHGLFKIIPSIAFALTLYFPELRSTVYNKLRKESSKKS